MTGAVLTSPIHILGAGSIGLLWAASIKAKFPSHPVYLLLREHHRKHLQESTEWRIQWKRYGQTTRSEISLPIEYTTPHASDTRPISTLLVTTKSYQANQAIQTVADRLSAQQSRVVLLCNGTLSVHEEVAPLLEGISILRATTTHGAYQEKDDNHNPCLVHAGLGQTFLEEGLEDLHELWHPSGLQTSLVSSREMDEILWKKLATNCVINPLTGLYGCRNGELLMEPSFPEVQHGVLEEVSMVARKVMEGQSTAQDAMQPDSLHRFVGQVIRDTEHNQSSMLQDILNGRKTEIEHLNGYIVRKGNSLGIDCPANEDITARIVERTR